MSDLFDKLLAAGPTSEALLEARAERDKAWKEREKAASRIRRCSREDSLEKARDAYSWWDERYEQARQRVDELEKAKP